MYVHKKYHVYIYCTVENIGGFIYLDFLEKKVW